MDNSLQEFLCLGKLEEAARKGVALYYADKRDIQLAVRIALIYLRLGQSEQALQILADTSEYADEYAEMPKIAQIEITRKCNLSCTMCPRTRSLNSPTTYADHRKLSDFWNREIDFDYYQRLIEDNPSFDSIIFHGIGEPLMHPSFLKVLQAHRKYPLVETSFFTNGMLLDIDISHALIKNQISLVTFSIDGSNPNLYEKIRSSGRLNKVIHHIQQLQTLKQKKISTLPQIAFHITLCKENHEQIPGIIDMARRLQVTEINISAIEPSDKLIIHYQNNPLDLVADVNLWKSLAQQNGQRLVCTGLELKFEKHTQHNQKGFCLWLWMGVYISVEGIVLPCCHLTDIRHYALGNIHTESLSNIWNNSIYQSIRTGILTGKPVFETCLNCPYFLSNKQ